MSRRSSASRRRNYGRRLHEMNERRPARQSFAFDWLAEDESDTDTRGMGGPGLRFETDRPQDTRDGARG
jgi:hypothetical protein